MYLYVDGGNLHYFPYFMVVFYMNKQVTVFSFFQQTNNNGENTQHFVTVVILSLSVVAPWW